MCFESYGTKNVWVAEEDGQFIPLITHQEQIMGKNLIIMPNWNEDHKSYGYIRFVKAGVEAKLQIRDEANQTIKEAKIVYS